MADTGAPPANALPGQAGAARAADRRRTGTSASPLSRLGGWDTHVHQGNHKGQLANRLRPLGDGLAALGPASSARTGTTRSSSSSPNSAAPCAKTAMRGTDHGHGNVIWVHGRQGARRPGLRRLARPRARRSSTRAATSRSPPITARARRRSLERHLRLARRPRSRKIFPGMPRRRRAALISPISCEAVSAGSERRNRRDRQSVLRRLDHPVRPAAVRPHRAGAFPAGLRPRHGRAAGRDRGDRRHRPSRPTSPTRSRRWSAAAALLDRVSRVFHNLDFERDQRRARRDRPRLRAEARGAPDARSRSTPACSRGSTRCTGSATRSASRPTSCGCWSATICASCAPARCSARRRRRGWPRSPSGWRRLHTLFGQNVLHDEDEWRLVLDEADLAGLPDFARAAAAAAARERGLDGKYVDHPVALLGRAVPDLLGAARSAPRPRATPGRRAASMTARTTTRR